jgi:hypothetical protein
VADWTTGAVVDVLVYQATDDLTLKWHAPDDASPGRYYLLIGRQGKTTRRHCAARERLIHTPLLIRQTGRSRRMCRL